jgi:hypothetical protein
MKKQLLVFGIALSAIAFTSCKKESIADSSKTDPAPSLVVNGGCTPTQVSLIAGQTINAGSVSVTNDATNIYVTYTTANGYVLTQTHLYVGSCNAIPVNNQNNPIPGHFPYNTTQNNTTTYTEVVPISTIGAGNCGCIAAHAVVVKLNASGQVIEQQTGWGNGTAINTSGGNWGMKFEYCTCTIAE